MLLLALTLFTAPDTLRPPAWVLTGDKPKVGDVIEAWLVVPRYPVADTAASVSVLPPATARAWFRGADASCSSAESQQRGSVRGAMARDTILFACVRPTDHGTLRLVAVLRGRDSAGTSVVQRIAVSDPMLVAPWFTLSPTLAAALSAIGGFLAGFLGHIVKQWWDRRQADVRSVKGMQETAIKALTPELTENRALLERWIESKSGVAPHLQVVGYNQVLGDEGIASYLGKKGREGYWKGIMTTYQKIAAYNDMKNANAPEADLKRAGGQALERLKNPAR